MGAIGQVDDKVAANDHDVAELHTWGQGDDTVGSRDDLLGIGLDDDRSLADFDNQRSGVAVPLTVRERVDKAAADILGRTRVGEIAVVTVGIDAELAELAGHVELSAGEARIFAALSGNGGDVGARRAVRAGGTILSPFARDQIAGRRCARTRGQRVGIIIGDRPGSLERAGSIFVPHNHLCLLRRLEPVALNPQWQGQPLTVLG